LKRHKNKIEDAKNKNGRNTAMVISNLAVLPVT